VDDEVGYCLQKDVIEQIPYMFAYIAGIAAVMQIISHIDNGIMNGIIKPVYYFIIH